MESFYIQVTGGREFKDADLVERTLHRMWEISNGLPIVLRHGDARGADRLSASIAKAMSWKVTPYPAVWYVNGKKNPNAGFERNIFMARLQPRADIVLAFPGGEGTAHMIEVCKILGLFVKKIR